MQFRLGTTQWCSRSGCSLWFLCRTSTWWGLALWLFSAYRGSRVIGELCWPGLRCCWSRRDPQWRALTLSTAAPLMLREGCRVCALLMSTKISFVLSTFRERLLSVHHTDRQLTSLLLVYFCDNEQAFPACLYYGLGFFHNLEHNFIMWVSSQEFFPSVIVTSRGKVMIKVSMKRCALRGNGGFNFRNKWRIKEGQMECSKLSE